MRWRMKYSIDRLRQKCPTVFSLAIITPSDKMKHAASAAAYCHTTITPTVGCLQVRVVGCVVYVRESGLSQCCINRWWHLQEVHSSPLSCAGDRTCDSRLAIKDHAFQFIIAKWKTLNVIQGRDVVKQQFRFILQNGIAFTKFQCPPSN